MKSIYKCDKENITLTQLGMWRGLLSETLLLGLLSASHLAG